MLWESSRWTRWSFQVSLYTNLPSPLVSMISRWMVHSWGPFRPNSIWEQVELASVQLFAKSGVWQNVPFLSIRNINRYASWSNNSFLDSKDIRKEPSLTGSIRKLHWLSQNHPPVVDGSITPACRIFCTSARTLALYMCGISRLSFYIHAHVTILFRLSLYISSLWICQFST